MGWPASWCLPPRDRPLGRWSQPGTPALPGTPCPPRIPPSSQGPPVLPGPLLSSQEPPVLPGTPLSSQGPCVLRGCVMVGGGEASSPRSTVRAPPLQEDSRPALQPWGRPRPQTHPGQVKVALHDSSRLNSQATRVSPRLSGSRAVPPCGLRPTPFITVSALPFSAPTARLILRTCTWHWERSQWPCGRPGHPRAHLGLCPAGSEATGKSGQSGRFPPVAEDPPCHRA